MKASEVPESLTAAVDGAVLAGSLWMPDGRPRSIVLMIPGSGPATRTCDGYFVPIIEHLLAHGHGVAAFDKRSAGDSTGSFGDTRILTQASDAEACLDMVGERHGDVAIGVFGHSQGGWVAFEVGARQQELVFVISNSGPAVGPARQERSRLEQSIEPDRRQAACEAFDQVVVAAQRNASVDEVVGLIEKMPEFQERLREYVAGGAADWELEMSFMRYEPASALANLHVETLVVHGEEDEMIPVQTSLDELARLANPSIRTALLPGASHRLLDQSGQDFVDGYLELIADFIDGALPD